MLMLPIRHHSPSCARHLRSILFERRPQAVLIEAPQDAEPLIPLLQHQETLPPVALYCTWRDPQGGLSGNHASYYPFCEFSPEWVAIRSAGELGCRVRFIDLPYAQGLRAANSSPKAPESLLQEQWLRRSRFIAGAIRRAGVRDRDELWDHWFESRVKEDPIAYFDRVLAWCAAARQTLAPEFLSEDGGLAREAHMAACIAEESGDVVVVTGGLHTPALLESTAAAARSERDAADAKSTGITLMRYGYEQLDALNGYASGMPSPGFYQQLAAGTDLESMLLQIARELRTKSGQASVAESIAAVEQLRGLMALRGHEQLTREDLYDTVRSVFVKGSIEIEGQQVLAITRKVLTGSRRGQVPAEAGQPPIVADFEKQAEALGLQLGGHKEHALVLDPYRKARDRARSRLLHQLALLGVPFAEFIRGPDFVSGEELSRIQEEWHYRWRPESETALIEASRYGGSLREAATSLSLERFAELGSGDLRGLRAAESLLAALRCGLHEQLPTWTRQTRVLVSQDPDFVSVSQACLLLRMAQTSCEPLELHREHALQRLATDAWEHAAYLLPTLADFAEEREEEGLEALCGFAETMPAADTPLLCEGLERLAAQGPERNSSPNPMLAGAALGLLYGEGRLSDAELAQRAAGRLLGRSEEGSGKGVGRFFRGLLRTGRSSFWQIPALQTALHQSLSECSEEQFLAMLPHLRLAFSDLTPRETSRVAADVAQLLDDPEWRPTQTYRLSSEDALQLREVDRLLRESLRQDGLEEWIR
ncbi:MAG: hypothetical protein CSA62_01205 [Planctomycetota bacterium]|nr:MAG: hypothetical protein CSA62_01205 [Planctomycetota bacterium]